MMCVDFDGKGRMVIKNPKTFFSLIGAVLVAIGAAVTQCQNCMAQVQKHVVKPIVNTTCDDKIRAYDSTLQLQLDKVRCEIKAIKSSNDTIAEKQDLTVEILKRMVSKEVIRDAVKEVKNTGKLPVE